MPFLRFVDLYISGTMKLNEINGTMNCCIQIIIIYISLTFVEGLVRVVHEPANKAIDCKVSIIELNELFPLCR